MITLYVHIEGLDTAMVEVDQMPNVTDTVLICRNPRRRDTKDLPYILPDVNTVIFPMNKILFIEVITQEQEEELEMFIRE